MELVMHELYKSKEHIQNAEFLIDSFKVHVLTYADSTCVYWQVQGRHKLRMGLFNTTKVNDKY